MRRAAFTLTEVMAVVTLLALLAGATVWSLAEDARRGSRADAVGRISHADRMARLTAQRLGRPCVLRFDLDRQRVVRACLGEDRDEVRGHSLGMPAGYRIDRIVIPAGPDAPQDARRTTAGVKYDAGVVEIGYGDAGRSISYAVRLARKDDGGGSGGAEGRGDGTEWVVFSGLTGQRVLGHDDDDVDNLFTLLTAGRPDAR